jgi:hypothetical protein
MTRQNLEPGETTTSIFSLRISSQPASILIILCLDAAARSTAESVSSNILMPASFNPSPSVNLETVLVLSFGLGFFSLLRFSWALCYLISKRYSRVRSLSLRISNSNTPSASYVGICALGLI